MHDHCDYERILLSYEINNDLQTDAEMDISLQSMEKSGEPEAHIISRSDYVLFVKNIAFRAYPKSDYIQ